MEHQNYCLLNQEQIQSQKAKQQSQSQQLEFQDLGIIEVDDQDWSEQENGMKITQKLPLKKIYKLSPSMGTSTKHQRIRRDRHREKEFQPYDQIIIDELEGSINNHLTIHSQEKKEESKMEIPSNKIQIKEEEEQQQNENQSKRAVKVKKSSKLRKSSAQQKKSMLKNIMKFSMMGVAINNSILCKKQNSVYIWGNGFYQARPDALLQFKNFQPKKVINLPPNIIYLQFGEYYDAGITKDHQLYVWQKQTTDSNNDFDNKDKIMKGITLIDGKIKTVKFTKGYMWALTNSGEVIQYPIVKQFDSNNEVISTKIGEKRKVDPLKGTVELQTGNDHIVTLNGKGEVWAMGDDTEGQCGQASTDRNSYPPYNQVRVKYPSKVKNLSKVIKIAAGGDHTLALDETGSLYGWGSNSKMQLSHEEEYSRMNTPLLCSYNALRISKSLDNNKIQLMAAGEQFSILSTQNKQNQSGEVYSFGNNLRGQLAIKQIKHVKDISKVQALSNYQLKSKEGNNIKVKVSQLKCGRNHCMVLLNVGYIMQWGDNQYGQMGNRKRSSCITPIIVKDFKDKKVVSIFAGENSSAAIIEEEDLN